MRTLLDEQLESGAYVTSDEQFQIEKDEVDKAEAHGRMLIINKKTHVINAVQREELQRHSALGGSYCLKPYSSADMPDFSYKSLRAPD